MCVNVTVRAFSLSLPPDYDIQIGTIELTKEKKKQPGSKTTWIGFIGVVVSVCRVVVDVVGCESAYLTERKMKKAVYRILHVIVLSAK